MADAEAEKKRTLLVIRDFIKEASEGKEFLALVKASRHRNEHLIVLRHSFLQGTKN